ncbi:hypothetical protein QEH42_gp061 [Microbacterium phage Pumpernickel]|uniref:Uncharacterized protein n=1 Tax=Microbacterium phage Pumpernickel TaxID=2885983 RepID=A0AAE8Y9V7_9CAUD|nr:hypothetical protein QEH42_gp061 [Microbacterium phage Pumpernickel]UDL15852.1 hypothetical protein SEA_PUMPERNICKEL_61 [Microbacterium phage Pumpernickel]
MSVEHDLTDTHVYHVVAVYSRDHMRGRVARSREQIVTPEAAEKILQDRVIVAGPFMRKPSAKSALTTFKNGWWKRTPQMYDDAYIEESKLDWKKVEDV